MGERTTAFTCRPAASAEVVADVRPEPRILGAAAPALKNEPPPSGRKRAAALNHLRGDCGTALFELRLIRIPLRHGRGDAVRGEHELDTVRDAGRQRPRRRQHVIRIGFDEPAGAMPVGDVVDGHIRQAGVPQPATCLGDILTVLQAARIAAVRGGDDAHRAADAVARHLRERVGQVGAPVAHADVDRQRRAAIHKGRGQPLGLGQGQLGDGGASAEKLVVMGDFLDPFGGNPPPAENVREKRTDVVEATRPTERNQQDRVEGCGHLLGL